MCPPAEHCHCEELNDGFVRLDLEDSTGLAHSVGRTVNSMTPVSVVAMVSAVSAAQNVLL